MQTRTTGVTTIALLVLRTGELKIPYETMLFFFVILWHLVWVYTVCSDLSVAIFRVIMMIWGYTAPHKMLFSTKTNIFSYFSPNTYYWGASKVSTLTLHANCLQRRQETICMKCQSLLCGKNRKKYFKVGCIYVKMCLLAYADSEGPDQPVHPCSLIRALTVH